jgi:membrane-associated phospholipid phosphatase
MPTWWHDLNWVIPLRHAALTPVFGFFTGLGTLPGYILIILMMTWLWQPGFINRLLPWVGVSAISNGWLKTFFQDPRPDASFVIPGYGATGPGMPSGHTQLAIFFWGAVLLQLAHLKAPLWLRLVAVLIAAMITFSRPYLGVHDVQDITVGGGIGLGLLLLFGLAGRPAEPLSPLAVAGMFGVFALVAFLTWPGGRDPQAVAPALALVIGWYGSQRLFGTMPTLLPRGTGVRLLGVVAGIVLVMALYLAVTLALHDWQAQTVLLLGVGLIGVMWPVVAERVAQRYPETGTG